MDDRQLDGPRPDVEQDEEVAIAGHGTPEGGTGPTGGAGNRTLRRLGVSRLVDEVDRTAQRVDLALGAAGALTDVARVAEHVGAEDVEVPERVVVVHHLEDV